MTTLKQRAAAVAELASKATPGPWQHLMPEIPLQIYGPSSAKPPILTARFCPDAAFAKAAPEMASLIASQAARIERLEAALRRMLSITGDSSGVAGYHLNGDVAGWGEFEEVESARAALAEGEKS